MIEFTPKEIANVGANRYMREKGRLAKALGVLLGGAAIGMAWMLAMESRIPDVTRTVVGFVFVLVAFAYYGKVIVIDASKAGKKFREQWDKEHLMVEGYREMSKENKS